MSFQLNGWMFRFPTVLFLLVSQHWSHFIVSQWACYLQLTFVSNCVNSIFGWCPMFHWNIWLHLSNEEICEFKTKSKSHCFALTWACIEFIACLMATRRLLSYLTGGRLTETARGCDAALHYNLGFFLLFFRLFTICGLLMPAGALPSSFGVFSALLGIYSS